MSLFPFTRPVVTTVLLLTLTTILTVTQDQEFDEAYYKPLPPGYSFGYLQTNTVQRFYYRQSLLECAFYALQSQSEFFTYNEVSHVCKNYSPKNIMTVVSTNDTNESSFYRKRKWVKAYFLSMGAGSLVYNSFMNIGNPSTWKVEKCIDNFCPNFFRNPILDFWSDLSIEEVKLVIYKNQTAVVDMVFDGRNTTLESWFSPEKLISSPWSDLPQSYCLPTIRVYFWSCSVVSECLNLLFMHIYTAADSISNNSNNSISDNICSSHNGSNTNNNNSSITINTRLTNSFPNIYSSRPDNPYRCNNNRSSAITSYNSSNSDPGRNTSRTSANDTSGSNGNSPTVGKDCNNNNGALTITSSGDNITDVTTSSNANTSSHSSNNYVGDSSSNNNSNSNNTNRYSTNNTRPHRNIRCSGKSFKQCISNHVFFQSS
ncbi:putative uncharacterized protein DDB_G0291812 [Octopus sinensis]|uniref:Uncharacterized protein n=1 Tax=Octopus sinensis TaxID=2607531 RepID=A0A7E6FTT1_9MOLL|nr:putative uncharacterized protein DDB_G0291812 [Octopus sinensis]